MLKNHWNEIKNSLKYFIFFLFVTDWCCLLFRVYIKKLKHSMRWVNLNWLWCFIIEAKNFDRIFGNFNWVSTKLKKLSTILLEVQWIEILQEKRKQWFVNLHFCLDPNRVKLEATGDLSIFYKNEEVIIFRIRIKLLSLISKFHSTGRSKKGDDLSNFDSGFD